MISEKMPASARLVMAVCCPTLLESAAGLYRYGVVSGRMSMCGSSIGVEASSDVTTVSQATVSRIASSDSKGAAIVVSSYLAAMSAAASSEPPSPPSTKKVCGPHEVEAKLEPAAKDFMASSALLACELGAVTTRVDAIVATGFLGTSRSSTLCLPGPLLYVFTGLGYPSLISGFMSCSISEFVEPAERFPAARCWAFFRLSSYHG
uniref:Uncharacterized protein n=1 Tax=Ixodes ricinus TaxID=34613 RepID=A0A6B0V1G6_IXORI